MPTKAEWDRRALGAAVIGLAAVLAGVQANF
jgi:hypothetical protein